MTNQNEGPRRTSPLVSVVLSFFNESGVLPELVSRLRNVLRGEQERGTISGYRKINLSLESPLA